MTLMIWRSLMGIWTNFYTYASQKWAGIWKCGDLYFSFVLPNHTVSQSKMWPHDHLRCIIWNDFWGIRRLIRRRSTQPQDLRQIWQHSQFFLLAIILCVCWSAELLHNTTQETGCYIFSEASDQNQTLIRMLKDVFLITSTKCFSLFNPWAVPFEGLRPWKYFSALIIHHNIHIQSM